VVRLNLFLLAALTGCALGLVTSQHFARKLFIQLGAEHERARSLEVEFGQLQLEQSTWAMHARVQKIASESLRMRVPGASRIELVAPAERAAEPVK
jgi:cell division protein FtsL